ncbi:hypothetical protein IW261DRAFT_1607784 [Armillaria novae-zelandiae]|uniref:MYND-type domain-containing protein n=1 Tax=Armillaria novae-zelandiae TaxID=153914 RepID=A0AA39UFI2_9AGAR|nr:hypothetical protein IW261DRAFT_1607784 [Armillaria novae-zelandiae]
MNDKRTEKLIKSAKGGSYEAMMVLGLQASQSRLSRQAFFRVMEENLKFNTVVIQDMQQGRLPLVPSIDPIDVCNLSCNSMLVLATCLRDQTLLKPVSLPDSTSSMVALMPAISFWLSLFCDHIILPFRTPEFTFIDFHRSVVFILAWTTNMTTHYTVEPKLFTDYLPFLWFHPPPDCMKYHLDDARALFTAVEHAFRACDEPQYELFVRRLEENSIYTAKLCVQFIVDEFAHISEESNTILLYHSFLSVASSIFQLAFKSLLIHTALLKNNILQWLCRIFRLVTRRIPFNNVTLTIAARCVAMGSGYIMRVMEDGHSYIYQLLGYNILLYIFKVLCNLHTHAELIDPKWKVAKTTAEHSVVTIMRMIIPHFAYVSILKRSRKAIFKIQQHIDGILESQDPGLKQVSKAWTEFVEIATYRSNIFKFISDSSCGTEEKCHGTLVRKFMVCSRCQFTLYCSRTCQRDDWSQPSTGHRSLCTKIRQIRADAGPLPVSLSDYNAYQSFTFRSMLKYEEWKELSDKYLADNGKPNSLWPMVWVLDYCVVNVEPDIRIQSSEQRVEDIDPENLMKAREGAGSLVCYIIPDGGHAIGPRKIYLLPDVDLRLGFPSDFISRIDILPRWFRHIFPSA